MYTNSYSYHGNQLHRKLCVYYSVCACVCVDLNVHKQLKIGSQAQCGTVVEGNKLNLTEHKEMR